MQQIINASDSDIFDVLAFVAYALPTVTRVERADHAKVEIDGRFSEQRREFLNFALSQYVSVGVDELSQDKLPPLLKLRYGDSLSDAVVHLGQPDEIKELFTDFQRYLYAKTL